ncbi:hypothetical protein IC580_01210 [Cupriavidus sp. ISTL7]|nr:hypothetical protein IC580_01210 [Cupriavidus sp. ISTL7]
MTAQAPDQTGRDGGPAAQRALHRSRAAAEEQIVHQLPDPHLHQRFAVLELALDA